MENQTEPLMLRLSPEDKAKIQEVARRYRMPAATLIKNWVFEKLTALDFAQN
jgi:hypothetical protein